MYLKPTVPLNISGIIEDGVSLWRTCFIQLSTLALLIQVLISLPSLYLGNRFPDASAMLGAPLVGAALALPYLSVSILASIILYNAIVAQLAACADQAERSVGTSLRMGLRFFVRAVMLALVCLAVTVLIAVPVIVMALKIDSLETFLSMLASPTMVLSLLAALVLYTYLFTRICVANLALVAENRGAIDSVVRSWQLTRGQWWRVSTVAGVLVLIFVVIGYGISLALLLVSGILGEASASLARILNILAQAPLAALMHSMWYALYQDLKVRAAMVP